MGFLKAAGNAPVQASVMADRVPCHRCGASLDIGPTASFVTCDQCGAELAVKRNSRGTITQSMAEAEGSGDDAPTLHRELYRLDRDWLLERQQYMVMNRYGRRYVPTSAGSIMVAAAVIGFGGVWTMTALNMGNVGAGRFDPFPFLGIVVIVLGAVVGVLSYRKARRYQKAYDEYRRRRQELLAQDEGE
jgi:hypothetical protein